MRALVTGGCGFIGHHFVEHIYNNTDWDIIIIDKLTYASYGFKRIYDIFSNNIPNRIKLFCWDLTLPLSVGLKNEIGVDMKTNKTIIKS